MTASLKPSAQKVQDELAARGYANRVIELPEPARSAVEAAAAVGCDVGQIAKSLLFYGEQTARPFLVITSGANRVDLARVARHTNEPLTKADAARVRKVTGYAIGGVPPFAHATPLVTYLDRDLFQFEAIWAAAGTPHTVVQLTPAHLAALTGGSIIDVK